MNAGRWVSSVAAYALPGARLVLPDEPLDQTDWTSVYEEVRRQRIPGLLAQAVYEGAFAATDAQVLAAVTLHRESMHVALALEQLLLDIARAFTAEGIDCRVLKGPAAARLTYSNPSLRSFGDIDLLVRVADYEAAARILGAKGFTRRFTEPRPGFDRRFGKGVAFVGSNGLEVDLHRTFVHGPFGLKVKLGDLFATASPFRVAGDTLLALGPEEQFLHACFHAALGSHPPRLVPLRDVAEVLLAGSLDLARTEALCRAWQAEAVVARAVTLAWDHLSLTEPLPITVWAKRYEPSRWERAALSAYTQPGRRYPRLAAAAVLSVPGVLEKARYIGYLLFPDSRYLRDRDRTYADHLLRGVRVLTEGPLRRRSGRRRPDCPT